MKEYIGAPFFASISSVLDVNSDAVAGICGTGTSLDEDREIAMLFAAAPELLSVLQEIVESGLILPHLKIKSQLAIAKALGESQ